MKDLILLNQQTGANLRWLPPTDFSFLSGFPLLPVQAAETGRVAASLPVAIVKDAQEKSGWKMVAVCGRSEGQNTVIVDGQWAANTMPESMRYLPFAVRELPGGKGIAAIDRRYAKSLLTQDDNGVPVYEQDGKLHPVAQARLEFLSKHQPKIRHTQEILTALEKARLFAPWPESVIKAGGITIEGLHTIDEKALHALDDETFLSLRKAGALAVAYSCLLSLYQVRNLGGHAAGEKGASQSAVQTTGDLDLEFLNDSETIKFGPPH